MKRTRKRNLASCLFEREVGHGCGNWHVPPGKVLRQYAEDVASLPSKNCNLYLSGQARSTIVMAFSRDCSRIASTHGDHTVRVCDIRTGKCTHVLHGHTRTPWCVAFHPLSNDILASGCLAGEVRIWDLQGGGSEVWRSQEGFSISSLAFHPNDNVLVFAAANKLRFWAWNEPEPFLECQTAHDYEKIRWVKFNPLGHTIYTGIANSSTIYAPDEQFYSSERSRNYADRHGRHSGQSAVDRRQPDGELSHLLARNDYDLPGISVQDPSAFGSSASSFRPHGSSATFNISFGSEGYGASRYAADTTSWLNQASSALANARRYAANETSRHYARHADRAAMWEVAQQRNSGMLHAPSIWDNAPMVDSARRRARVFLASTQALINDSEEDEDSEWSAPNAFGADSRASYPIGNASASASEARPSVGREALLLEGSRMTDVSQRLTDHRSESSSGHSGSFGQSSVIPTVVVTWEGDAAVARASTDDLAPDNEAEEVTSTAAEVGSTASLGESIDADIESRSVIDAEMSMFGSGTDVAASGSSSASERPVPTFNYISDLILNPGPTTDWNAISNEAAAAASARRPASHLPSADDVIARRRWRRYTQQQQPTEVDACFRRLRPLSMFSTIPDLPNPPNATSSAPRSDSPSNRYLSMLIGSSSDNVDAAEGLSSSPWRSPLRSRHIISDSSVARVSSDSSLPFTAETAHDSLHRINADSSNAFSALRYSAAGASSGLNQHQLHNCSRNCEICCGINPNMVRPGSSHHDQRSFPSRLSQVTRDRLRLRSNEEFTFDPVLSGHSSRFTIPNRREPAQNWFADSTQPDAQFPSGPSRLRELSWRRMRNDNTQVECEQRLRQEGVTRIQQRFAERAARRRERNEGITLQDRLQERHERMRVHLEELRSRLSRRGVGTAGESVRALRSSAARHLAPSPVGHQLPGLEAVRELLGTEDRDAITNRLRNFQDEMRLINVEMNRNARILQRSFAFDEPTERLAESSDSDDRVQAAINQAIHGAFISNGGEASVGANLMDQTFRIQAWDSADYRPPDLTQVESGIVVRCAKLHNDSSCDISQDGTLLCTFIQSSRTGFAGTGDVTLGIFSLVPGTRGQCLYRKSFGPNAISVSLSPLNNFVLVGLASKRFSWIFTPKLVVAQVFRLKAGRFGDNSLEQVGDILHSCDMDFRAPVSMNSARWIAAAGEGLVYGTNRGDLHICQPGADAPKPEADNNEMSADANPVRQSLMQMLGLAAPRTISTSTQTGSNARRSASTQTEQYGAASSDSTSHYAPL